MSKPIKAQISMYAVKKNVKLFNSQGPLDSDPVGKTVLTLCSSYCTLGITLNVWMSQILVHSTSQIKVHELIASCSTHRQTPGHLISSKKPNATKDQVEYMKNSNKRGGGAGNKNKRNRTRHKIVCKIIELYRIGPSSPGRVG